MTSLNIAIAGATGRMGKMLIETIYETDGVHLSGALDIVDSPWLGCDAGESQGIKTGVHITSDVELGLQGADVLIDFTRPEGSLKHLEVCVAQNVKMVIGTTGFDEAGKSAIHQAGERLAIVFAPNMSVGVNATLKILEVAARILDTSYDVEIIEAHHRHKVDAPSGTALCMGEVIARARGHQLQEVAVYGREGFTGERRPETIGFATVRGGDIVGDHTVLFAGLGERIEIVHKSSSRASYALGSVRAAQFLAHKSRGLFDMQDVLGLK